jgi:2'-deoxycytidine 5'-triphosphate deaminase (DCD)
MTISAASARSRPDERDSAATGVLPAQRLREAIADEWLVAGSWRIPAESVQPASVDLRLGERA